MNYWFYGIFWGKYIGIGYNFYFFIRVVINMLIIILNFVNKYSLCYYIEKYMKTLGEYVKVFN